MRGEPTLAGLGYAQQVEIFRAYGGPVVDAADLLRDAPTVLSGLCAALGIGYDPAMLTWPKAREQIAAPGHGSKTFRSSRGGSLAETLQAEFSADVLQLCRLRRLEIVARLLKISA